MPRGWQGITKHDLALFYESIGDWILPHLEDRPTALVRCPEGVSKECFYQKHVGAWMPSRLRRVKIKEKTKVGEYLVVDDLAGLVELAQIGVLEIHTWNSVVADLERPNRLVFDLDPDPAVEWPRVIEPRPVAARRNRTGELGQDDRWQGASRRGAAGAGLDVGGGRRLRPRARRGHRPGGAAPLHGADGEVRSRRKDLRRLLAEYPRGDERGCLLDSREAAGARLGAAPLGRAVGGSPRRPLHDCECPRTTRPPPEGPVDRLLVSSAGASIERQSRSRSPPEDIARAALARLGADVQPTRVQSRGNPVATLYTIQKDFQRARIARAGHRRLGRAPGAEIRRARLPLSPATAPRPCAVGAGSDQRAGRLRPDHLGARERPAREDPIRRRNINAGPDP